MDLDSQGSAAENISANFTLGKQLLVVTVVTASNT